MRQDWSDAELLASIDAYREMMRLDASGVTFSKKQIYRDLAARFGRSDKAYEFRMQNISAVLDELGLPWIDGLKPKGNVGAGVKPRLIALLSGGQVDTPVRARSQPASYKAKLPSVRRWLIEVARSRGAVTYTDVMLAFEIDRFSLRHAMDYLGHEARDNGEPILTALIVGKSSKRCSIGLATEFGVHDDEGERQRLYAYWNAERIETLVGAVNVARHTSRSLCECGSPARSSRISSARFHELEGAMCRNGVCLTASSGCGSSART